MSTLQSRPSLASRLRDPGKHQGGAVSGGLGWTDFGKNFSDVRRDGYRNVDLSLLRNFALGEGGQKIQFRGEFINAFNRVVFGTPGSNASDPANFGRITTQGNTPRLIQLVLRFTF